MNQKSVPYIVLGLVIIGIIFFLSLQGKNNSSNNVYSGSILSATEKSFDFKVITMKDGEVSHNFEVKNEGTEPVVIGKVYTSCMCTEAYLIDAAGKKYGAFGMPGHTSSGTNITVGPGETIILDAVFDPAAHGPSGVGFAQRSIYLETNSTQSPKMEFNFQATVTN